MGYEIHANITAEEIRRAIDRADELFELVLIAEKMDESLILLKELLCWDYADVVFFTKNARTDTMKKELAPSSIEKIRRLQSADILLYDHFLAKHKEAVVRYGEKKMAAEVSILRALRQEIFDECGIRIVNKFDRKSIFKEYSNQVNGYILDDKANLNCLSLTLPELQLINKVRRCQKERIANETAENKEKLIEIQELIDQGKHSKQKAVASEVSESSTEPKKT